MVLCPACLSSPEKIQTEKGYRFKCPSEHIVTVFWPSEHLAQAEWNVMVRNKSCHHHATPNKQSDFPSAEEKQQS